MCNALTLRLFDIILLLILDMEDGSLDILYVFCSLLGHGISPKTLCSKIRSFKLVLKSNLTEISTLHAVCLCNEGILYIDICK